MRLTTDSSGAIALSQRQYPFGETNYNRGSFSNKRDFTSYVRDDETGAHYAMARFYGNSDGRFLSVDRLHGRVENPQSLNRYAYVRNNPTNLFDPWGLEPEEGEKPRDSGLTYYTGATASADAFPEGAPITGLSGAANINEFATDWDEIAAEFLTDFWARLAEKIRSAVGNCPPGSILAPISSDPFAGDPATQYRFFSMANFANAVGQETSTRVEYTASYERTSSGGFQNTGQAFFVGEGTAPRGRTPVGYDTTIVAHTHDWWNASTGAHRFFSDEDKATMRGDSRYTYYLFGKGTTVLRREGGKNQTTYCLLGGRGGGGHTTMLPLFF